MLNVLESFVLGDAMLSFILETGPLRTKDREFDPINGNPVGEMVPAGAPTFSMGMISEERVTTKSVPASHATNTV